MKETPLAPRIQCLRYYGLGQDRERETNPWSDSHVDGIQSTELTSDYMGRRGRLVELGIFSARMRSGVRVV